ncbi:spermidine synthase [Robbsia sp. Bb-Pol-6]|uniref:Spermidine synthase n=1 Tax=Robbsia betulipollinis TaxID=2981849 RepID=A0ABT3ZPV2_9BURK|nr:spermidine synthase [Robbsia betulipollinis]MCY0388589.1 spermidine synthase [Robbsia betulipollinis]
MSKLIKRASAEARAFGRGIRRAAPAAVSDDEDAGDGADTQADTGPTYAKRTQREAKREMPAALAQADRQVRARQPRFAPVTFSELAGVRYLHFGTEWVQGAMRLRKPFELELEYAEQMMAWLLFLNAPARVTQLGLGAAALTKWCYRELPESRVEAVELNPSVVIAARSMFALPDDDARLAVIEADAWDYVNDARQHGQVGVLQVDLYDATARGPMLDSVAFYRACRATLAAPGMLTVNLFGDHPSFERNMRHLKAAFDGRVVALPEVHEGNRIALAFSGPPLDFAWSDLQVRAAHVGKRYRLPAGRWITALKAVSPAGERFVI